MTATRRERFLKIGSRGSQLALWQARYIAGRLNELAVETQIEIIRTTGDHLQTASRAEAGGKGLFTKEIEEALLQGAIDVAVHSLKDLPAEIPKGLTLAAIPQRGDARDAMVGCRLADLVAGARVGTSSGRRAAQLRMLRPDIHVQPVRGNVDTRLRKLREGRYDALVLARSGLQRLGLDPEIVETLSPEQMCPAPGQGALAVETREGGWPQEICGQINDEPSSQAVACERAVVRALGGHCELPLGAYAESFGDLLEVSAIVISADGTRHVRVKRQGDRRTAEKLGQEVAEELASRGAGSILDESR